MPREVEMGDDDLPEAPGEQAPEKNGLLSRGVGAIKDAQAQAKARSVEKHSEGVRALDERLKANEEALRAQRQALIRAPCQALIDRGFDLYEYRVVSLRSTLVGDKMNVGDLQGTLDQ